MIKQAETRTSLITEVEEFWDHIRKAKEGNPTTLNPLCNRSFIKYVFTRYIFCRQALQSMVLKVLETKIQISMEKKKSRNCLLESCQLHQKFAVTLSKIHFIYRVFLGFVCLFLSLERTQPFPKHQDFWIHSSTWI